LIVMSALLVPSTLETNKDVILIALPLDAALALIIFSDVFPMFTATVLPVIVVGDFKFGADIIPYPNKRFDP
jgi:hypothetical protein